MVCVSAIKCEGIQELKETLLEQLTQPVRQWMGSLKMPISHAFNVSGIGTVATGTILRGKVKVKDLVEIRPSGKQARVKLRAFPEKTFLAQVRDMAPAKLEAMPDRALSARAGGEVVTFFDVRWGEVPRVPSFEVTLALDNRDGQLMPGMTGRSRIVVGKATLAQRLGIALRKKLKSTFRF